MPDGRHTHMIDALESEVETIDRHFEILGLVAERQPIGIVKLSDATGYPTHKVRYSLRVLEEESLVEPTDSGATTTEEAEAALAAYRERLEELRGRLRDLRGSAEAVQPP